MYRKPGVPLGKCSHGHFAKSAQDDHGGPYGGWRRVTPEEVAAVQALPDSTAAEVAEALGTGEDRVRYVRKRYGRRPVVAMCERCHVRPVWAESARARAMGLCKGCFIEEERRRAEEERESAALRQYRKRTRDGRGRGGH